jgi:hypothetical protein
MFKPDGLGMKARLKDRYAGHRWHAPPGVARLVKFELGRFPRTGGLALFPKAGWLSSIRPADHGFVRIGDDLNIFFLEAATGKGCSLFGSGYCACRPGELHVYRQHDCVGP